MCVVISIHSPLCLAVVPPAALTSSCILVVIATQGMTMLHCHTNSYIQMYIPDTRNS